MLVLHSQCGHSNTTLYALTYYYTQRIGIVIHIACGCSIHVIMCSSLLLKSAGVENAFNVTAAGNFYSELLQRQEVQNYRVWSMFLISCLNIAPQSANFYITYRKPHHAPHNFQNRTPRIRSRTTKYLNQRHKSHHTFITTLVIFVDTCISIGD